MLTDGELFDLLDYFEHNKDQDTDFRDGYSHASLNALGHHMGGDPEFPLEKLDARIHPLVRVLDVCKKYFESTFEMKNTFTYKRGFLNEMSEGAWLGDHNDDDDIYAGKVLGEVHYSALLFLTGANDYEGGELVFTVEDREFKIKPARKDLILFKGDIVHGVSKVLSGRRVNFVIFFRDYNPSGEVIIDLEDQESIREEQILEYESERNA